MLTLLEILWWIVLFPVLCTFAVNVYWRRKLESTRGASPYASIAGFIFGGWYGYVVTFCVLSGGGFLRLFYLPKTPQGIQGQVETEFLGTLVGLATALGGRYLARRLTRPRAKDDGAQTAGTDGKLNSI